MLKIVLYFPPAPCGINYIATENRYIIILAVDASLKGWGSYLMQLAEDRYYQYII